MKPLRWLTILAVAVISLVACTNGSTGNKAGGDAGPVVLRIGTNDYVGRPAANAVQEFVREVKVRSGGRLRIQPVWQAGGDGTDDWDQVVARMVKDGQLDLGMIPARAWDTEGVTSLRALQAPFLVTSDDLADQIVASDLAVEMMAGLDKAGVTGLALMPESLRHPFGFGRALVSPSDYSGKTIRTPRSELGDAMYAALGAKPDDPSGAAVTAALNAGTLAGYDLGFVLSELLPMPAIAAGNVTFDTKVDSLVINSAVLGELTPTQRRTLQDAATATRGWVIGHRKTEAEAARTFCGEGGTIVAASDADLRALMRAEQPVYDDLERDAATKRMLDRIRELKRNALAPKITAPCHPGPDVIPPPPSGDRSVLNGIYRFELTQDDLRHFGVTNLHDLAINEGLYTWRLQDGHYEFDQRAAESTDHLEGGYIMSGNRVTFQLPWVHNLQVIFSWRIADDKLVLQLQGETEAILETLFTAHPWTKIA